MASLKAIRKRISSVTSTQKITRAMKMVAGARLNRAQQRITELRPYAVKTQEVLWAINASAPAPIPEAGLYGENEEAVALAASEADHPLLVSRPEKRVLLLVLTSDRGLCGAFNANINKRAEAEWRERTAQGQEVQIMVIGRKGNEYLKRRGAPVREYLAGVWDGLGLPTAERVGKAILAPFLSGEVDAVYILYNEFKSAMSQNVVAERLLPVGQPAAKEVEAGGESTEAALVDFRFEPGKTRLLEVLAPMYVDISVLRALYESMASFLGAQMTAMEAATNNARDMIERLTLQYNKARQAAITTELMEIIGGSEALKE